MAAVVLPDDSSLREAVAECAQRFPGITVNQVIRLAALTAKYGRRFAVEMVLNDTRDVKLSSRNTVNYDLTPREKELVSKKLPDVTVSEAIRMGLKDLAGYSPDDCVAAGYVRPGPKGPRKKENQR